MRKLFNGLLWILGTLLLLGVVLRALVLDVWKVPNDPMLGARSRRASPRATVVVVLTRGTPASASWCGARIPRPLAATSSAGSRACAGDKVDVDHTVLLVNGQSYDPETACAEPKVSITDPATGNAVQLSCNMVMMGPGLHRPGDRAQAPARAPPPRRGAARHGLPAERQPELPRRLARLRPAAARRVQPADRLPARGAAPARATTGAASTFDALARTWGGPTNPTPI